MSIVMEKVCDKCQEKFSSVAAMKCHKKIHEAAAKVFKEVVLEKKEKCIFGDCEHPPEDHEAGLCWHIVDTKRSAYNEMVIGLLANTNDADSVSSVYGTDTTANGFKIRYTHAGTNAHDGDYIYIAFAETPFKYANAR